MLEFIGLSRGRLGETPVVGGGSASLPWMGELGEPPMFGGGSSSQGSGESRRASSSQGSGEARLPTSIGRRGARWASTGLSGPVHCNSTISYQEYQ
ncbi:hypothetical protein CRG98_023860 [Punica granatum]|uniref:Uncharacterized protein n=1 Tax=Punica granatum TaxID=22663 RepID=A0A2I0JHI5_PUNGR|nr:hypothetical protein CRG98_023860 [Punica granatum]